MAGAMAVDAATWSRDAGPRPNEFADARAVQRCNAMDIVFVIDDSGSMADEQQNLRDNFPTFVDVLDSFTGDSGEPLDYRVAVTTTGITKNWTYAGIAGGQQGDDGAFRTGCGLARPWLERGDPGPVDAFACLADVGVGGPLFEMPLEAVALATTERVSDGSNAGFRRQDALLAVIVLTDEEDCSRRDDGFAVAIGQDACAAAEPEASYLSIIDSVAGGRERWALAVIAGTGPDACFSSLGSAMPATRLMSFATMTGANAVVSSICDGDLATPLATALATFEAACSSFPEVD